jgi:hypothetical protein
VTHLREAILEELQRRNYAKATVHDDIESVERLGVPNPSEQTSRDQRLRRWSANHCPLTGLRSRSRRHRSRPRRPKYLLRAKPPMKSARSESRAMEPSMR